MVYHLEKESVIDVILRVTSDVDIPIALGHLRDIVNSIALTRQIFLPGITFGTQALSSSDLALHKDVWR